MKRRSGPLLAITVFLGLLVVASALLLLGRRENRSVPDSTSYGPSGARAFADLLRKHGYRVRSERRGAFRLDRGAIAIALRVPLTRRFGQAPTDRFSTSLQEHIESGGRALVADVAADFLAASRHAQAGPANVTAAADAFAAALVPEEGFRLSAGPLASGAAYEEPLPYTVHTQLLVRDNLTTFAGLASLGGGLYLKVQDGLGFTNRFLDQEDNAAFAVRCLALLSEPGAEVVFLEAAHTESAEPSLPESLGPWAVAGWNQAIVLFLVIVLTLGVRFGEPHRERASQKGARELADAIANLYLRSRATQLALGALAEDADRRLRAHLKIPRDAPASRRDEAIPKALAEALRKVEVAAKDRTAPRVAAELAQRLQILLDEFLGSAPRARGSHGL